MTPSKLGPSRTTGDPERSNAGQNLAGPGRPILGSKDLPNAPGQILAEGSNHLPQKRPGARATLREHAAATLKVIALSGGLLGGLWLLQMAAQK